MDGSYILSLFVIHVFPLSGHRFVSSFAGSEHGLLGVSSTENKDASFTRSLVYFRPSTAKLGGCVCVCHLRKGISVVRGGGLSCQIISIKLANCI